MSSVKSNLEKTNPERVDKFVADAGPAVKKIVGDFKNFQVAIQYRQPAPEYLKGGLTFLIDTDYSLILQAHIKSI